MDNLSQLHVSSSKWYLVPFACVGDCHLTAGVIVATLNFATNGGICAACLVRSFRAALVFSTEACLGLLLKLCLQLCVQLLS
jgi:hypothetical protein